jgi:hypothetical protein
MLIILTLQLIQRRRAILPPQIRRRRPIPWSPVCSTSPVCGARVCGEGGTARALRSWVAVAVAGAGLRGTGLLFRGRGGAGVVGGEEGVARGVAAESGGEWSGQYIFLACSRRK